jgi:DNA-binding Lrp family transcriptional regulator
MNLKMDIRIENIFQEAMKGDTSFQEIQNGLKSRLFGRTKYDRHEMRETWNRGVKLGIEIGLNKASLEGQRIELNHNTSEGKNKEFIEKFYKLAEEYKCAIQYHPQIGMVVLNREY